ncbi:hypothetical protein D3C87_1459950 [compost metagenome]
MFAVTFHVALLKIGGKAVHILVVRQNSLSFCIKEIDVPYTDQRKYYRDIDLKFSIFKMFICGMCPGQ